MSTNKANHTANVSAEMVHLPPGATFLDGQDPDPRRGGILVTPDGDYFSLAAPRAVPGGVAALNGSGKVLKHRLAKVSLQRHTTSQPTTYGGEVEALNVDGEGHYTPYDDNPDNLNELYTFMGEGSTPPTDDPIQLERNYTSLVTEMVVHADSRGNYIVPVSVVGQREPLRDEVNPHPHVKGVTESLLQKTGFETRKTFRVAGAQDHTRVSNTEAAIEALEAMQLVNPILMAPSLAGPHLVGGIADRPTKLLVTPRQLEHLRRVDIGAGDLKQDYLSWRYILRRMGSVAGIWLHPPSETLQEYLYDADWSLALGSESSIDRLFAPHGDRLRSVLDQSGASTAEGLADDTYYANPRALTVRHLLRSALFTTFEKMSLEGHHPAAYVANRFGIGHETREDRLKRAHAMSLRVSRKGNDALVYERQTPGQWLPWLLRVSRNAPFTRLTANDESTLGRMYASNAEADEAARKWLREHGKDTPAAEAYHATLIGSPAVYQRVQYAVLRDTYPNATKQELVRLTELKTGQALHNFVLGKIAVAA